MAVGSGESEGTGVGGEPTTDGAQGSGSLCLNAVFHRLLDAVIMTDSSGAIIDANPAACVLTGFAHEDLLRRSVQELSSTDRTQQFHENWAVFIAEGRWSGEWALQCQDGRLVEVECNAVAGVGAGSHLCVLRDVSRRKQEVVETRIQKELLQSILDHIPLMVNLLAPVTNELIWVNREWERVIGRTLAETRCVDIGDELYPQAEQRARMTSFVDAAEGTWEAFSPTCRSGQVIATSWTTARLSDGSTLGIGLDTTARGLVDAALRQSQERFKYLTENTSEVFWIFEPATGTISYLSPAYETVWGRPRRSLYEDPSSFFLSVHPDDAARIAMAFREGSNVDFREEEYRILRPDGEVRWIWDRAFPVHDEIGTVRCVVGLARDITQRKLDESALLASERRFRALTENSWEAVCLFTPGERIVYSSPSATRLLGYTTDEFLARRVSQLVHPNDLAAARARLAQSLVSPGLGISIEVRMVHSDGSWRWMEGVLTNLLDEPSVGAIVANYRDVTQRKRAEAQLKESQERLEIALSRGNIGLWDWDLVTGEVQMSPQFQAQIGYSEGGLPPRIEAMYQQVHPDDLEAGTARTSAVLESDSNLYQNEFRMRHRDGHYVWFHSQGTVFRDEHGQAVRVLGVHVDITATKEIESELRATQGELEGTLDDLERAVQERTTELADANRALHAEVAERQMTLGALREAAVELEAARLEAESANAAKSEFLSRMSHELRTPLNAILGFGQLLGMSPLVSQDQESVEYILAAGKHLLHLVDEVLDITRIETGNLLVAVEPVQVAQQVREVLDMTGPLAGARDITLVNEVTDNATEVEADGRLFRQVLLNLVSNAIKFDRRGGTVTVAIDPNPSPGHCRVGVHDTGPGLTPEEVQKLFTPFERLNAAQMGVEGTGIGLALSRRLTQAMGGGMGVSSIPGVGSHFWLELACAANPKSSPNPTERALSAAGTPEGESLIVKPPAGTVLLVEANGPSARFVERLFHSWPQFRLLHAGTAANAMQLAHSELPDFILIDLYLPDWDGEQLLSQLRSHPTTSGIPVAIMAAEAMPETTARLQSIGASAFLVKPLGRVELGRFLGLTTRDGGGAT